MSYSKITLLWILLCILLLNCNCKDNTSNDNTSNNSHYVIIPVIVGDEDNVPFVSVYVNLFGLIVIEDDPQRKCLPFLVVAIWPDGKIVWSKDQIEGGPPYFVSNISPKSIKSLYDELAFFNKIDPSIKYCENFGPDSFCTTIAVYYGKNRVNMMSWHELAEAHPNIVATSLGKEGLGGREREDVLAHQPKDYKEFRKTWSDIRKVINSYIPGKGKEIKDIDFDIIWM